MHICSSSSTVVYFDKKYIAHKANIKRTNIHKMKAKCHVISTKDDTKVNVNENHSTYFHCGPMCTDRTTSVGKTVY